MSGKHNSVIAAVGDRWIEKLEVKNVFTDNAAYRAMWDEFNRTASLPL